jgi:hypothetical protein
MPVRFVTLIAISILTISCGAASAPTEPTAPVTELSRPVTVALAGQSNAWLMRPIFENAYPQVVGFAQDGSRISEWAVGTSHWSNLEPALKQPLRAFVWWQGESDRHPGQVEVYGAALEEFLTRVRLTANDPNLFLVICRVIDHPAFARIRTAQEAYVARTPRSVLVSSDGLPLEFPESAHLSPAGYEEMVRRILAVIP